MKQVIFISFLFCSLLTGCTEVQFSGNSSIKGGDTLSSFPYQESPPGGSPTVDILPPTVNSPESPLEEAPPASEEPPTVANNPENPPEESLPAPKGPPTVANNPESPPGEGPPASEEPPTVANNPESPPTVSPPPPAVEPPEPSSPEEPLPPNLGPIISFVQAPTDHKIDEETVIEISVKDSDGVASTLCNLNEKSIECDVDYTNTFSNLNLGEYKFTVVAEDTYGHSSTRSHSWNVNTVDVICDPFDRSEECPVEGGLVGNVYYLDVGDIPGKSPIHATFDDYINYGSRLPMFVYLNEVNIPAQDFSRGFRTDSGDIIAKPNGQKLLVQFSVRMKGLIRPNTGEKTESYEFAMLSDDGMRVILDEQTILDYERPHSPTYTCTQGAYKFAPSETKLIKVDYIQALANHMAMQLLYRKVGDGEGCPEYRNGYRQPATPPLGWKIVPPSFFISE